MDVDVLMGVHVVEAEPGCAERLELRLDLLRKLASDVRESKKPQAGPRHIRIEHAVSTHQARNLLRRQNGQAIYQDEMESNP